MLVLNQPHTTLSQNQSTLLHDINEIHKVTRESKYSQAYKLDLSIGALTYLAQNQDIKVAIFQPEALTYTQNLEIIKKDTHKWKIY